MMSLVTEGYFQILLALLLDTFPGLDHTMDIPHKVTLLKAGTLPKVGTLPTAGTLLKVGTLPKAGTLPKGDTLPMVDTLLRVGTLHLGILLPLQDIHQPPIRRLVDIRRPVIQVNQLHIIQVFKSLVLFSI